MTFFFVSIALLAGYWLLVMGIRDIHQAWLRERAWRAVEAFLLSDQPMPSRAQLSRLHACRWQGDRP